MLGGSETSLKSLIDSFQSRSFLEISRFESKNGTIIDIKHPISEKRVNNQTGMIEMSTDLGSLEQTEHFNPLDQNSY
jgi:hypothetical protein